MRKLAFFVAAALLAALPTATGCKQQCNNSSGPTASGNRC